MEEEQKINDFKVPFGLNILLFVFFTIWCFMAYGCIYHYLTFGFDELTDEYITIWASAIINIIAGIYSAYAVIQTLRKDKDCIVSLKFALFALILYSALSPDILERLAEPTSLPQFLFLLFRPVFYLTFLLYVCFSKTIKEIFPKCERKFGPSGWLWIGIFFSHTINVAYGFYMTHEYVVYSVYTPISALDLKDGEISDGYIIFKSDRKWEKVNNDIDTIFEDFLVITEPTLISKDSLSTVCLSSGAVSFKPDMRTFNTVITLALKQIDPDFRRRFGKIQEESFTDTVVNGNRLKSSIFMTENDSVKRYYSVSLITDSIYPKSCIFVRMDKNEINREESINLAEGVRFDLKHILKSKNNVRSNKK